MRVAKVAAIVLSEWESSVFLSIIKIDSIALFSDLGAICLKPPEYFRIVMAILALNGCRNEETVNPAHPVQRSNSPAPINPGGVETGDTVNTLPATPPEKPSNPIEEKEPVNASPPEDTPASGNPR